MLTAGPIMPNTVLLSEYAGTKTSSSIMILLPNTYSAWVNGRDHMLKVLNQTLKRVAKPWKPAEHNLSNPWIQCQNKVSANNIFFRNYTTTKFSKFASYTRGEFLNIPGGHLGRLWEFAMSAASAYSSIWKVKVGPCGDLAKRRCGRLLGFERIKKCVTPNGPATLTKSLRLFRFFSCQLFRLSSVKHRCSRLAASEHWNKHTHSSIAS